MPLRSLGRDARLGSPSGPAPPPARPTSRAPAATYRADAFSLGLAPGWSDATTHTVAGPVADGQPHNVTIVTAAHDGRPLSSVADDQVRAVLEVLPGGALLLRDGVALEDGSPAERVVFRWSPVPGRVLYQQQVYAVVGGRAVTMAASFTARSRRVLGPEVHRMMLSLTAPRPTGTGRVLGR